MMQLERLLLAIALSSTLSKPANAAVYPCSRFAEWTSARQQIFNWLEVRKEDQQRKSTYFDSTTQHQQTKRNGK